MTVLSETSRWLTAADGLSLHERSWSVPDPRAVMLYLTQIGSAKQFRLARDIDPKYGAAFDHARLRGVEAMAWKCMIARDGIEIATPVPVVE